MIGKFWDELFDYADDCKKQGKNTEWKIVHDIEDMLQKAYDKGLDVSVAVKNREPRDTVEKLALSVPDILVYEDKNDGQIWYELECDGCGGNRRRFDEPEEVLKYVIDYRSRAVIENMGFEKNLMLDHITRMLKDIHAKQNALKEKEELLMIINKRLDKLDASKEILKKGNKTVITVGSDL